MDGVGGQGVDFIIIPFFVDYRNQGITNCAPDPVLRENQKTWLVRRALSPLDNIVDNVHYIVLGA